MQRLIFYIFLIYSIVLSCSKVDEQNSIKKVVLQRNDDAGNAGWHDVFVDEQEISFSYSDSSFELLTIPLFIFNKNDDYIIPDGNSKAIKRFNNAGKFLQIIGKWGGQGPGEFLAFGSFALNNADDLLIFDLANYRLSKFVAPNYLYNGSIKLSVRPSHIVFTPQNQLVTYSFSEYILNKWDINGNLLKKEFKPAENLRMINFRFNLGGIADNDGKGFYFIYPENNYEIRYYDYDLNLKMIWECGNSSRFHPRVPNFPKELSPLSFSPGHSKWWDEFLHVTNIHNLGNNLFGVSLYESKKITFTKYYFNVYSFDGKVYAEGLEVPYGGIVTGSKNGFIYVSVAPQMGSNSQIVPAKLLRYKLNFF